MLEHSPNMRLDMLEFPVHSLRFGSSFDYQSGKLQVDPDALTRLVLADHRIETAEFAIACPGDQVRITGVRDVVEPRIKPSGAAQVFPGAAGPVVGAGAG